MLDVMRYLARTGGETPVTFEIRQPTVPAAGAEWSQTVPPGEIWLIHAVHAILTASAVVATRFPTLVVDDQTTRSGRYSAGAGVTAGQAIEMTWDQVGAFNSPASSTVFMANIPADLILQSGWRLRSLTSAIDAGDQWSSISVTATIVNRPLLTISERAAYAVSAEAMIETALRERGA